MVTRTALGVFVGGIGVVAVVLFGYILEQRATFASLAQMVKDHNAIELDAARLRNG